MFVACGFFFYFCFLVICFLFTFYGLGFGVKGLGTNARTGQRLKKLVQHGYVPVNNREKTKEELIGDYS